MTMNWLAGMASAMAETAPAADAAMEASPAATLISYGVMIVMMIAVFYFMLIRPQRKKDKQVKAMLDALKPGDRVLVAWVSNDPVVVDVLTSVNAFLRRDGG